MNRRLLSGPRAVTSSEEVASVPEAEQVASDAADIPEGAAAADSSAEYEAPLLDINTLRRGAETQLTSRLSGELEGARAAVSVKPLKGGATEVKVRFHNLRGPEPGARYVLWAVGPDKTYTRLGQVDRPDKKLTAKIDARTTLRDFGLFITAESDVAADAPSGPTVAMVVR